MPDDDDVESPGMLAGRSTCGACACVDVAAQVLIKLNLLGRSVGAWAGLLVMASDRRTAQLQADRARTRAISRYLRDHREEIEQLFWDRPGYDAMNVEEKRRELVRLARQEFNKQVVSDQEHYLSLAGSGSRPSVPDAVVQDEGGKRALSTCDVGAKVRRKVSKTAPAPIVHSAHEQQLVGVLGSATESSDPPPSPALSRLVEPPTSSGRSCSSEKASPGPMKGQAQVLRSPSKVKQSSSPPKRSAHICSTKDGDVGASGCGTHELKRLLPRCLPMLNKLCGDAAAAEMLACAWRFVDRYPNLFKTGTLPAVQVAVVFGVAAKLTQSSDTVPTKKIWAALAKPNLEPQIRELEAKVVHAFGRADLNKDCM